MIARRRFVAALLYASVLTANVTVAAPKLFAQTASTTEAASASPEKAKEKAADPNDEYRHSPMVTKLGSMAGMNAEQASTAFTVTNLLILLGGIGYLLYKNLPKAFRSRSSTIKKEIVEARSATEEARVRLSAVEERLAKLDQQIAAMKSQAEADGEKEAQRLMAAIEDEKAKILVAAESEIQSATSNARRELQKYAAELAVDQAERKLVITPETDRFLIAGFAERLQAMGEGKN